MTRESIMKLFDGFVFFGWGEWSVDLVINLLFVVLGLMATFTIVKITVGWFI